MDDAQRLRLIGERAANEIPDGAVVGLGTGATASAMVIALAARVRAGLRVTGVATSSRTADLAREQGVPLAELADVEAIDLCIDGADEIDPGLHVVKGGGGALLHEKLVGLQAKRYIIVASAEKLVSILGTRLPLPVEIVPFGWPHTARAIAGLDLAPTLRLIERGDPFVTDGGHFIVDCETSGIADPVALATALKAIPGVVEHGLFVDMTDLAWTIDSAGEITEHVRP